MTKIAPIPTPSLNGNSAESLITQCRTIMDCARELEEAIGAANDLWHGRNYLPQGSPEAMEERTRAQDWWHKRRARVTRLKEEVLTIALAIQRRANP